MVHDGMFGFGSIWLIIIAVVIVVPFRHICMKAGHSGWLSLLILVPFANVAFLYFLAFAEWPSLKGRASSDS